MPESINDIIRRLGLAERLLEKNRDETLASVESLHRETQELIRESHARLHVDVSDLEQVVRTQNSRIGKLELAKARMDGVRSAYAWVGPTVAAVIAVIVAHFIH